MTIASLPESEITRRLAVFFNQSVFNPFPQGFFQETPSSAAILIPFTCINQEWHLLFIRRTQNEHDRHGGQVAFPGGRVDAGDPDVIHAALRETEEEVGIRASDVQILGRMNDFHSITNYLVTPIVGTFPWPYRLRLDPDEVGRAFTTPLAWLADPANHQVMKRYLPQNRTWPIIYFDPYDGEALWGFTAQVVLQLLEALKNE